MRYKNEWCVGELHNVNVCDTKHQLELFSQHENNNVPFPAPPKKADPTVIWWWTESCKELWLPLETNKRQNFRVYKLSRSLGPYASWRQSSPGPTPHPDWLHDGHNVCIPAFRLVARETFQKNVRQSWGKHAHWVQNTSAINIKKRGII